MADHPSDTDLILRHIDGGLTDDEFAQLNARLANDPEFRGRFIATLLQANYVAASIGKGTGDRGRETEAGNQKSKAGSNSSHLARRPSSILYALAAALVLAAAVATIYVFVLPEHRPSHIEDRTSETPIATLIDSTGTVVYEDDVARSGGEYAAGSYSIESGSAQILLRSRVTFDMRGETRLAVRNPRSVYLESGYADFNVPHGVTGFTVHLPDRSRIVDLGTAFSVEVDDDSQTELRVTEGRVRWHPAADSAEPVLVSAGMIARLIDGVPVIELTPEAAIARYATGLPESMAYARLEPGAARIDRYLDATFGQIPPALAELPAIIPTRGAGSNAPGAGYAFTLKQPARLYLLVHDRGDFAPDGWERTELAVAWTVASQQFNDTVYTRLALPGQITIPTHTGKNAGGQHGVPHVCLIAPIPEPVLKPDDQALAPNEGPLKGAPK